MSNLLAYKEELETQGFTVINNVYTAEQAGNLLRVISSAEDSPSLFRKTEDLFAIRRFLEAVPQAVSILFNERLKNIIANVAEPGSAVVKAIYFDKPAASNWFVAYHQDLTVSVRERINVTGFGSWTKKEGGFAVQPPAELLQKTVTVRIHLDDTDESNGALRVLPGTHRRGIVRTEAIAPEQQEEVFCPVQKGGVMVMKPLLFHASGRTTNGRQRRVVHLELSNGSLPGGLAWSEYRPV